VKLTASHRLYGLGLILLVALTVCARNFSRTGEPLFLLPLAVAGVAYLLAVYELLSTPRFSKGLVIFGLALAGLWHILFLRLPPGSDDDIHRYVWDGRLQRLGYNPYFVVPSDPSVRRLHTAETRTLNNPDVPSPYPAGAQLFFRAVTAIHESTFSLKVAFVICDVLLSLVLLDLLRGNGQPHLILAYAWNPLLAIEVAGSGHVDIVGALLLLVSFAALRRRWRSAAALAFGLAVAIKLLPIVLLPLYWKRVRMRDAVFAAAVVGLLYLPFLNHGGIPIGSLITYVQTWRFNDPVFAELERLVPQIAAGIPMFVGFTAAIWIRLTWTEWCPGVFAWPMAAALLCAPVVYPWYLLWLLPFLGSVSTLPVVVWTVSIIPTYVVWHLRTLGAPWSVPAWITFFEYGSVALAGVWIAWCRLLAVASIGIKPGLHLRQNDEPSADT
jgi:alpha-1,6-mannosyltransferase